MLCLFAATVFWFFNALNKNYSANINFPVVFDYDHEKYIPVRTLPATIRLNVNGLGWDLFRKSSGLKVPPLVIPLERPTEIRKIVGSTLPALFATQLEGLQVNFVLTDTVHINIEERARKRILIRIDSVRKYIHPDFGIRNEVVIEPDTIWVEGPRKTIDTVRQVVFISLPSENINRDFKAEIEVNFQNNRLIRRHPPVVEVRFEVEKMVEVSDKVALEIVNVPARFRSAIEVKEVNCTFRVPASRAEKLPVDSLRAEIDLKGVPRGKHRIAPVIRGLPSYTYVTKIDTVRINF